MFTTYRNCYLTFGLLPGLLFAGCNPGDTTLRTTHEGSGTDETAQQSDATAPRAITGTNLVTRDNVAIAASWGGKADGILTMRVRMRLKPGVFVNADGFGNDLLAEKTTFSVEARTNGISRNVLCAADRNLLAAKCSLGSAVPVRVVLDLFDQNKNEDFAIGQPIPSILSVSPANGPTSGGTTVTLQLSSPVDGVQMALRFGSGLCAKATSGASTAKCAQTPAAAQPGPQPVVLELDFGNILVSSPSPFAYEGPPATAGGAARLVHLVFDKDSGSGKYITHFTYDLSSQSLADHGFLQSYPGTKTLGGQRASVVSGSSGAFVSLAIAPQAEGMRTWKLGDLVVNDPEVVVIPLFGNNWQTYVDSAPVSIGLGTGLLTASHLTFADNNTTQHVEVFRSAVALTPRKMGYVEDQGWSGTAIDAFRSIAIAKDVGNAYVAYVHPEVDFGVSPPHIRNHRLYVAVADLLSASNSVLPIQELSAPLSLKVSQVSMIAEVLPNDATKLHFALVGESIGLTAGPGCKVYYASVTRRAGTYVDHQRTALWDLLDDGTCTSTSPEFTNPIYRPQIIKTSSGIMVAGMRMQTTPVVPQMIVTTMKLDSTAATWGPRYDMPPLGPYSSSNSEVGRFFLNETSGSTSIVTWSNYAGRNTFLWQPNQDDSWPINGLKLHQDPNGTTQLIGATVN